MSHLVDYFLTALKNFRNMRTTKTMAVSINDNQTIQMATLKISPTTKMTRNITISASKIPMIVS